jgi:RNA polymerase-binding transcription factor DksA
MQARHRESRKRTLGDIVTAAYDLGSTTALDPAEIAARAARHVERALVRGENMHLAVALSGLARDMPQQEKSTNSRLDKKTTEALRRVLLVRKESLLRRQREALADEEQLLAEREPDWEDLAATRTAAALLEGLSETEVTAIVRIQSALDRIANGTYGTCVACHRPIDKKRLRAVPDANRCGACAGTARIHTS